MRIGVLTSVHPATDTRILFKQAATLAAGGHEVFLVARASEARVGCGVIHVPVPVPRSRLDRIRTCLQVLRAAVELRCDVYHLHDPELLPLAAVLRRRTGAAIVFDVHEDVRRQIRNKYWIPAWARRPLAWLYGVAEHQCLRQVDRVVIAEDSYAETYAAHHPVPVRNYPTLDLLAKLAHWDTARTYSGKPRLVYCGTVARIRGALEMIDAAGVLVKKYPALELAIIGACFPADLENEMRARIAAHGIESNVRLYGRMPLDRAMEVVAGCDVGLALLHPDPNYLHSLPTKMFEYMALRLPVVVSNFELWKSIVDASGGGKTVNAQSVDEVVAAIDALVADPETLRQHGDRGCRAVRSIYSWTPEGERLLGMYRGLACKGARALADVHVAAAPAQAPPDAADRELVGAIGGRTHNHQAKSTVGV